MTIGYDQEQAPSLSEGVKLKVDAQTQVALFGKVLDRETFGVDFGSRMLAANLTDGAAGTFNTTFVRTALLGRLTILSGTEFSTALFAGAETARHVERRCSGLRGKIPVRSTRRPQTYFRTYKEVLNLDSATTLEFASPPSI